MPSEDDMNIPPGKKVHVLLSASSPEMVDLFTAQQTYIRMLAGAEHTEIGRNLKQIEHFSRTVERLPDLREEEERTICEYDRVKETAELHSQTREAYSGLLGSGNSSGQRFVQLAAARGAQLEEGVSALLDDYRTLQSRCAEGELDDARLAEEAGITLAAFARGGAYDLYANAGRLGAARPGPEGEHTDVA